MVGKPYSYACHDVHSDDKSQRVSYQKNKPEGEFLKSKKYGFTSSAATLVFIFYLILIVSFLLIVMVNQRNYNDPWILDGILVPTLVFVFIFFIIQTFVKSNQKIALVTSLFLVALNLIAGFKYSLFYNPYDSTFHFRFASQLSILGRTADVPTAGAPSNVGYYSGDPGMHILWASLSVVSGISMNDIFRFVIPATYGLIPLIVFFLTKNILSRNVQKYVLVASTFFLANGYIITGTSLSMISYFLFFAVFLRLSFPNENKKEFAAIFVLLGFTLITSHPVTPIFAAFLLMGLLLGLKILHSLWPLRFPNLPASPYVALSLLFVVMLFAWWANLATVDLNFFAKYIKLALSPAFFMTKPAIPTRFFHVPLWAQLTVFFVLNIDYAIVGGLGLLGLIVFLRRPREKRRDANNQAFYVYLLVFIGIIAMYLLFIVGFGLAALAYQRFVLYALPFLIVFMGLPLLRLNALLSRVLSRVKVGNLMFASLLFILFSLSLIQFFNCQPLIPNASVLGKGLPGNDSLADIQLTNTDYQKQMISFVASHSSQSILASDFATQWQIYGFSNGSLYSRTLGYSPLNQPLKWDLLLLHTTKAGPFEEPVENRTETEIENIRIGAASARALNLTGNLIYDNGESFVISHVDALTRTP